MPVKRTDLFLCSAVLLLVTTASACGDDDEPSRPDDGTPGDGDGDGDGDAGLSHPDDDIAFSCDEGVFGTPVDCEGQATDYAPDADDDWDDCISDDGAYHPFEPSISTIARVEAFERIAVLLLDSERTPTADDFLEARLIYQEEEGLDSRVVRRYDPHVEVPEGTDCAADGVPAMYPEHCVGAARLQVSLLDAFNAGIAQIAPRAQAARIEATLLWFLAISTYKESLTCTDVVKDCDSSHAYYTGGADRHDGLGLSRYVREVAPEAHEAAWDGLLAVRCWRDLDRAVPATDLELRDLAREQYDRAVLRGFAAIVRARLVALTESACDEDHAADVAFVRAAAPLMQHVMRDRSREQADAMRAALGLQDSGTAIELDIARALEALDATLGCP